MFTRVMTLVALTLSCVAFAQPKPKSGCGALPSHAKLKAALEDVMAEGVDANTGLGNPEWAAVVDRNGVVCAVVFSGNDPAAPWPGSRLIAAEKANTANALSGPRLALSTANLFAGTQPGQSLFSLVNVAPPNPATAFAGSPSDFGQEKDPMVGKPIGGVVVFGGGLALYGTDGKIIGGLGLSGDTSCADHVIAWKVRSALNLDAIPGGVAKNGNDNLILDFENEKSASGFGHPSCKGGKPSDSVIKQLAEQYPTGPSEPKAKKAAR